MNDQTDLNRFQEKKRRSVTTDASNKFRFPVAKLWPIIWAGSLLFIFEAQIPNTLAFFDGPEINLLFGVWPADIGLMLPILIVLVSRRLRSIIIGNKGLMTYLLVVSYGVALGLIKDNWFSALTADLRTSLGLISGLCLVAMAPKEPKLISRGIVMVVVITVLLSAWIIFTSPMMFSLPSDLYGVTESSAFIIIGLALCLMGPAMILPNLMGQRFMMCISWMSVGSLLLFSVIVMRTRTLSFTIALTVLMAVMGTVGLGVPTRKNGREKKGNKFGLRWIIIFLLIIGGVFFWQRMEIEKFVSRLEIVGNVEEDVNWIARMEEINRALETMEGVVDHLTGTGFGVQTTAPDSYGDITYSLHIGILNLWWKLGVLSFLILVVLILILGFQYVKCLWKQFSRSADGQDQKKARALVICAPGALTLAFTSFFSGGWNISPMISVGILWGVYRKLRVSDF